METKRFLVIDGNALVHRAYHALPPLKTKKGELVNAVYGFTSIFLKALKELAPDFVAATFDLKGPTFRHKEFKEYKAKRVKAPEELYQQLSGVKKVLSAFGVPIFEKQGFEADDLIGTIVQQAKRKQVLPKVETIILSGDLDALQLVDDRTKVYTMRKGIKDTVLYGVEEVKKRYNGLRPQQMVDFKALRGDASDNIPGVTGIGEKTAIQLLKDFGSLEEIYKTIEERPEEAEGKIKKSVLQKLKDYKEQAFISKKLATIHCNVDIGLKLQDCEFQGYNQSKAAEVLKEFEFYTLFKRLPAGVGGAALGDRSQKKGSDQQGLFGKDTPKSKEHSILEEIDRLQKQGVLSKELAETEKALVSVVKQMQKNGIGVDIKALNEFSRFLGGKISQLKKKIYKIAGKEFNLNSPQQLSEVLFDKLKISTGGLKKTPGGVVSTGAGELKKLGDVHPIVKLVLEYRELFKLKSGFVDALPKMLSPKDGRIHPNFHQLGTETGRMSCSNPNLQNIPVKGKLGSAMRKCFVPEQGFQFLSADYSQMELRILASIAGDKKMLQFFKQGKDIHQMTASEVFNIKEAQATKEQRKLAKALNYGVLYGMGPYGFAERTGVSLEEAKEFIKRYFDRFKEVASYVEGSVETTKKKGFSETLFGRKRFLEEINSKDPRLRTQAERMARNFPAQGTAADIMKMAMARIGKERVLDANCRLLLQIHDELLFEAKEDKAQEKARQIKRIMEGVVRLDVVLEVEVRTGKNWGEV